MTNRNEQAILKDLSYEWKKLKKDSGTTAEEKAAAKKAIVRLQTELKAIKPETDITDFEKSDREYKANKTYQTSTETDRLVPIPENHEFSEIEKNEQDAIAKKALKLFEQKLIVQEVAKKFGHGFDNPASVGQIVSILNQ